MHSIILPKFFLITPEQIEGPEHECCLKRFEANPINNIKIYFTLNHSLRTRTGKHIDLASRPVSDESLRSAVKKTKKIWATDSLSQSGGMDKFD
jgi:hypothetical protein